MGKVDDTSCFYCNAELDDVEHTFFACVKWRSERQELQRRIGNVTPDNIVDIMLATNSGWNEVAQYVEAILRLKKTDMDNQN